MLLSLAGLSALVVLGYVRRIHLLSSAASSFSANNKQRHGQLSAMVGVMINKHGNVASLLRRQQQPKEEEKEVGVVYKSEEEEVYGPPSKPKNVRVCGDHARW
jgi:hypothetical protein